MLSVMLSPFASLRVNFAKHLQYLLENKQTQILRSAQDDSPSGSPLLESHAVTPFARFIIMRPRAAGAKSGNDVVVEQGRRLEVAGGAGAP